MTAQRNHYEVLGVPATATADQIKTKYYEMARMFHPDVAKDKALGQKMFTQINQAYRILKNPERRTQYDADLRASAGSSLMTAGGAGAFSQAASANGRPPAPSGTAASPQAARASSDLYAISRVVGDADFALMNGDAAAAQTHCEAALRMDPQNAKALGLLGDALAAQGRREEAAVAYRRALQVAPSPMIQAKLSRLDSGPGTRTIPAGTSQGIGTRTIPPGGNGTARSTGAEAKPKGGLIGRLLGKDKK